MFIALFVEKGFCYYFLILLHIVLQYIGIIPICQVHQLKKYLLKKYWNTIILCYKNFMRTLRHLMEGELVMRKRLMVLLQIACFATMTPSLLLSQAKATGLSYEQYIRDVVPSKEEIDVFLNDISWARFDADVGYILSNYIPRDGIDGTSTISTIQANGARTSFMYKDKPCRINTYGNSFTQCNQVNDGETWQEYLAAHLGEPVGNFGMGGFGVYQAYRRMVKEEQTAHGAEYVILYIWGDDHIRSLLRCRYAYTKSWNETTNQKEGIGRMFHGNFWSHVEMDMESGKLVEKENILSTPQSLYKMTDPDWMYETLKDDWALQMFLYRQKQIDEVNIEILKRLSKYLECPIDVSTGEKVHDSVYRLLDEYSFEATKYILNKAQEFTSNHGKKLLIVLLDPGRATRQLLEKGTRFDGEIVEFLKANNFNYFDMNLVHVEDYKSFKLSVNDYMKRYYIGHYNPAGNHLFAYALKNKMVEWLNPKPLPYQDDAQKMIQFKEYISEQKKKQ